MGRGSETVKSLLIVYYSWSNGNTERVAERLQSIAGGDLLRIDTAEPYKGSYDDVVQQGQDEVESGFEPELKPFDADTSAYDVVAVGTPTWWYTMAPAVKTLLHRLDLSGKTVVPFMTNGGWPGHVIEDIEKACPGAEFACEMRVRFDSEGGARLETPEGDIDEWAENVRRILEGR